MMPYVSRLEHLCCFGAEEYKNSFNKLPSNHNGESVMFSHTRSPEQRRHIRYRLKENIYIDIQGNYFDSPASVADLNRSGLGFYSVSKEQELADKFIVLDLMFNKSHFILRSLTARVVFTSETTPHEKDTAEASRRYGLQFVNLSPLQKKQLDLVTKKYAKSEHKNNLPT